MPWPGRTLLPTLFVLLACSPATAFGKKPTQPVTLDLKLRQGDLKLLPSDRDQPRGYEAVVRDDPWSILGDKMPRLSGPSIPQIREDGRQHSAEEDELSLKRLLDGATIPLLRIKISPPF